MALINHVKREINAKIVYYGREGTGKRLSLQYLYDRIKPSLRGELKTVPASGDTLLFFDFSPFEQPVFGGYRVRFHMYSLTGRVTNPAAWKMTLKGADGVVIVSDNSPDAAQAERSSIARLRVFLSSYGVGLHDIPCVLQLNGASGAATSPDTGIAANLDVPDMRMCQSDVERGVGVLEALSLISRDILARIGQDESLQGASRAMPPETAGQDDKESSEAIHIEPGDKSQESDSDSPVPEDIVVHRDEQNAAGDVSGAGGRLKVSLVGDNLVSGDGTVRIPLDIAIGGKTMRVVVSVRIELPEA